jgi:hypothetical protein
VCEREREREREREDIERMKEEAKEEPMRNEGV